MAIFLQECYRKERVHLVEFLARLSCMLKGCLIVLEGFLAALAVREQHYTHVVVRKEGFRFDFNRCLIAVLSCLLITLTLLDDSEVVLYTHFIVECIFDRLKGAYC